jgi:hypothetical protein
MERILESNQSVNESTIVVRVFLVLLHSHRVLPTTIIMKTERKCQKCQWIVWTHWGALCQCCVSYESYHSLPKCDPLRLLAVVVMNLEICNPPLSLLYTFLAWNRGALCEVEPTYEVLCNCTDRKLNYSIRKANHPSTSHYQLVKEMAEPFCMVECLQLLGLLTVQASFSWSYMWKVW